MGQLPQTTETSMQAEKNTLVFASEPLPPTQRMEKTSSANNIPGGRSNPTEPNPNLPSKDSATDGKRREDNTWTKLFRENRHTDKGQRLRDNLRSDDKVHIQSNDIPPKDSSWGYCAIGYFSGRFPGKDAVYKLCENWEVPATFHFHASGWIIFQFANEYDRDRVSHPGHYSIFGCQLHIRTIPQFFTFDVAEMCIVPIWVTFLPLELWSEIPLSRIAGRVGVPITTDQLTREQKRCSYARVLIHVDASKPLVRSFRVHTPCGL